MSSKGEIKKRASEIQSFFGVTLPNMIYNNDRDVDLEKLTETVNIRKGKPESVLQNRWKKGVGGFGSAASVAAAGGIAPAAGGVAPAAGSVRGVEDPFSARQAACESVGSGDQFEHLSSLASSENTQSRLRCGWVYNNTNPNSGRGAYGNSEGPLKTDAKGVWMWDLNAAKEKYHVDICKDIQGCQDIDASIYKGRCGWCTKSGKAVPTISNGVAYPYLTSAACPANQLVTSGSRCPPPKPLEDPTGPRAPGEVCTPLQNGALPRDCLIQKATAAGCSDEGALVQALRGGSNNDYLSGLTQQKAYKTYQERATIPLNETAIKTGKITIADTLNEFKRVQDHSASEANTGLKSAARDLCLNKGFLDTFDFCSEIKDTQTGPFQVDCLQKAFLQAGGQKAGSSYPGPSNIGQWNSLSNWAAVKARIQQIFGMTRSSNRRDQESGMMQFYGIRMQNKQNPLPHGPEIAWKGKDVKISCQRPLPIPAGYKSTGCIDDNSGEMLDTWAARNGWTMGTPPGPPPYKKVPGVDWPGNDIYYTTGKTIEECQVECDKRPDCVAYNYGFGTSEKYCWFKNTLQNRWDTPGIYDTYIKEPQKCKAPFANPPAEVAGWKYKGCWRDCHQGRGLPNRLPNVKSIEECIAHAKERGFNVAGNQFFGECWAGNNTDWNKMGDAGCCEPLGGGCTQQIYASTTPVPPPAAPAETYDNDKTYAVGAIVNFKGQKYRLQEAAGAPGYAPDRQGDRLWVRS